jgi:hypothetical protein
MVRSNRVGRLWLLLALAAAVIAAPLARPMASAWRCYARHAQAERTTAQVIAQPEPAMWVLRVASGPNAGASCSAKPGTETAAPGESLEVVYLADRAECVPVSTVERSKALLLALTSGLACVLFLLVGIGLAVQRGLARPGVPKRRMEVDPGAVVCPACGGKMAEGYVLLLAGMHWREPDEPIGLPHALAGLPGTVGWRGRPCLHAFRCASCEILVVQYGARRES